MSNRKRIYPTYWQQWIGKFAIKCASEFYGPTVVYVEGITKNGSLVGKTLNSGIMFIGQPYQLVAYTPRLFSRLDAAWSAKQAAQTLSNSRIRACTGRF